MPDFDQFYLLEDLRNGQMVFVFQILIPDGNNISISNGDTFRKS